MLEIERNERRSNIYSETEDIEEAAKIVSMARARALPVSDTV